MSGAAKLRLSATVIVAACMAYLAAAYLAAPEFWTLRDRNRPQPAMLTATSDGIPGDPINIGLVGTREELLLAFGKAGWKPADPVTFRTSVQIGLSVLFDRPDPHAPVSPLYFEGRPQDLAFEKPVGISADERHHVRFWRAARPGGDGRPLWLGAATFDRGVGFSHETGQITHHIGPDLDAERDLVLDDLRSAGRLSSTFEIAGIGATTAGRNGGGDLYFTDGKAVVGALGPVPGPAPK